MLRDKLIKDLTTALKSKNALRVSVLRMIISAINNREIEMRKGDKSEINDAEVLKILTSEAKKRKEALEIFNKSNREDLALKESNEYNIIKEYLPELLSGEEILKLIRPILKKSEVRDFGQAMKLVLGELRGKADSKLVADAVKKVLSES